MVIYLDIDQNLIGNSNTIFRKTTSMEDFASLDLEEKRKKMQMVMVILMKWNVSLLVKSKQKVIQGLY
jgi:hypothetical protein